MKICNICNIKLELDKFYKHPTSKDGVFPYCKECSIEKSKKRNTIKKTHIKNHNLIKKHNSRGIKPPINYYGNKYVLFSEIKKYFPNNIDTFYDLMCGSGMIGANIESKKTIMNDINSDIINILISIRDDDNFKTKALNIQSHINNKEDFNNILNNYNNGITKNTETLYALMQNCFMQNLQYDKMCNLSLNYNSSCYFNVNLLKRMGQFSDLLKGRNITFTCLDYKIFKNFDDNDFIFLDPPYINTLASYNNHWDIDEENKMYKWLDNIKSKWMICNTSNNNSIINWAMNKGYSIIYLKNSKYKSANKSKNKSNEILVINYLTPKTTSNP